MREADGTEIKKLLLEMMDYVDAFCKKEEISYSLCAGTMLGAVRHKGFIPWDDDIDIMMMRKDYLRFVKAFSKEKGRYYIISWEQKSFPGGWAKVCDSKTKQDNAGHGLSMDIFPMDWCGYTLISSKLRLFLADQQNRMISYALLKSKDDIVPGYQWIREKIYACAKKKGYDKIQKERARFLKRLRLRKRSRYMTGLSCGWDVIYKSSWFDEMVMADFEGRKYPMSKNYDKMLTIKWGDYMIPVPEDERIPHFSHIYLMEEKDR